METSQLIKYARKARNMTQQELGEKLGFKGPRAQVYVAQYEAGTRPIPRARIKKAAHVLDIPVESLLP